MQSCAHFSDKLEITIESGCLMWGIKVIVPNKLQGRVLEELHISHTGIVRMKALSRSRIWWPEVEKQIEEMAQKYESCQCLRNKPALTVLHPMAEVKLVQLNFINNSYSVYSKIFMYSVCLISDLLVVDLFLHSLPGMFLLYMAASFLYQRYFCM